MRTPRCWTALDRVAVGRTQPDLTFILDLPAEVGLWRAAERMAERGEEPDRFERDDRRTA